MYLLDSETGKVFKIVLWVSLAAAQSNTTICSLPLKCNE